MSGPVVEGSDARSGSLLGDGRVVGAAGFPKRVCPHLEMPDGRWRHAGPSRDHRCAALVPPSPVTVVKQRRLCLGAAHVTCANYLAALEAREAWADRGRSLAVNREGDAASPPASIGTVRLRPNRWGLARMLPTIAAPERGFGVADVLRHRSALQAGLVALLVVAFLAVAVSRPPADRSSGALLAPTATAITTPTVAPTERPTVAASASAAPSPSPTPTIVITPTPDPPTAAPIVHRVVAGDTLSGLAGTYRTTVKAIMDLNALTTTTLRVGQQLLIPSASSTPRASASPG